MIKYIRFVIRLIIPPTKERTMNVSNPRGPRVTPSLRQVQEELGGVSVEPYNSRFLRKAPRQQRGKDKLKLIVETAEALLSDETVGLNWFNTGILVEKAGIPVGTLYVFFEDAVAVLDYVWPNRVTVLVRT